ncbi:MAG TPA: hypothetical protein VFK97_03300, partial [Candidatus Saccharimonadales bacterium]|nr:hypothetical protein [Candidatus Saccharimonadales bacterium]
MILLWRKFIRVAAVLATLAVAFGVSTLVAQAEPAADGISTSSTVTSTTAATTTEPVTTEPDQTVLLQQCNHDAVKNRAETWHWQTLMGRPRTPSHYQVKASNSLSHCQAVLNLWHGRAGRWQSSARQWMQQRILN